MERALTGALKARDPRRLHRAAALRRARRRMRKRLGARKAPPRRRSAREVKRRRSVLASRQRFLVSGGRWARGLSEARDGEEVVIRLGQFHGGHELQGADLALRRNLGVRGVALGAPVRRLADDPSETATGSEGERRRGRAWRATPRESHAQ